MAQKIEARFFNVRRFKTPCSPSFGCFLHGKQFGTIYKDGKQFWATVLEPFKSEEGFATFAEAEMWVWQNWKGGVA